MAQLFRCTINVHLTCRASRHAVSVPGRAYGCSVRATATRVTLGGY